MGEEYRRGRNKERKKKKEDARKKLRRKQGGRMEREEGRENKVPKFHLLLLA